MQLGRDKEELLLDWQVLFSYLSSPLLLQHESLKKKICLTVILTREPAQTLKLIEV